MDPELGLRERKKALTRQHIADVAAALFAERGFDAVTMQDVAGAAEVSDQTVYNYFPAKHELVLDRAEQVRELYRTAIEQRDGATSPAAALMPLVRADVERYRATDPDVARGEFIAQSVASVALRRFVLEERERQTVTIAGAVVETAPRLPHVVAHAHAAAIVAVVQHVHDRIGAAVLSHAPQEESADALLVPLEVAFSSLDRTFAALLVELRSASG